MEKLGLSCIADGNVKWCSHCMAGPSKNKHRISISSSNSIFGYMPKRIESRELNRYWYDQFCNSIIHNSLKVETTKMSLDRWMDKRNVVYTCNEIMFSLKKEGNFDTFHNTNGPWRCAKWNKPDTEGQISYDSACISGT